MKLYTTMFFRLLAGAVMIIGLPVNMFAVTPEEMEEARTITARIYLRCANSGSDYLDKVSARTLGELEGKLKGKEKENLATFKSFSVPTDYASWTKDDLVKYWSGTFYANPQVKLEAKGYAQKLTQKALGSMKIKDLSEAEPAKPEAEEVVAAPELPDAVTTVPTQEQTTQAVLDTLAENMPPATPDKDNGEGSNVTLYIVLLCVLVVCVVALILYAARMFRRQSGKDDDDGRDDEEPEMRKGVSNVNVNIGAPVSRAAGDVDYPAAREAESLRAENAELRRAIDDYKYHLNYVKSEKAELQEQVRQLRAELEQARKDTRNHISSVYAARYDEPTEYAEEDNATGPAARSKTLYLGRANEEGMFMRAERELNPMHTIFRLVSSDGITGTFTVVASPGVESRVMADVRQALRGSCDCDFSQARGCSGIETVRSGTAIFDQGRWKVLRRAQIRFV